jgi:hypothetical protein
LVSFPPLIDMLKFSGYPYLIRGQPCEKEFFPVQEEDRVLSTLRPIRAQLRSSVYRGSHRPPSLTLGGVLGLPKTKPSNTKPGGLRGDNDARTGMPFGIPKGAICVQRFDDSLEFCNSHYLSHFAAFFIDARTKRSVVESFALIYEFYSDTTRFDQSLSSRATDGRGPEDV